MPDDFHEFLRSYSGMDGGSLRAPMWICGIEHGGGFENLQTALRPEAEPGAWTDEFKREHPAFSTWQYHQKVAKVLVAARHIRTRPELPATVDGWRQYMAEELYVKDGETFKLNLFPLASPAVKTAEWTDMYGSNPALRSKEAYYETCRIVRFPFIREMRSTHRPKVILATGKAYRDRFAEAFGFQGRSSELKTTRSAPRQCAIFRDETGSLIVSPFFGGRYGMNSNSLLVELGGFMADELGRRG